MEGPRPDPENSALLHDPSQTENGGLRLEIANAVVHFYKEYLGKGPVSARAYVAPELVVVVMGGGYTAGEQMLFEAGKWYEVRAARQHWQDSMKVKFVDKIEELTGSKVKAFMSANHQDPDLAVELFVLEAE